MTRDAARRTDEVIADHLRLRVEGRTRENLERNYADDVVVLSHLGHFRGREAVDTLARLLDEQLKEADYVFDMVLIDAPYAVVQWSADAREMRVSDGVDSFVMEEGKIRLQTIYYSISTKSGAVNAPAEYPG